jgi:hypothetical protein
MLRQTAHSEEGTRSVTCHSEFQLACYDVHVLREGRIFRMNLLHLCDRPTTQVAAATLRDATKGRRALHSSAHCMGWTAV